MKPSPRPSSQGARHRCSQADAAPFVDDDELIFACGSQRARELDHRRQTERRDRSRRFIAS